MMDCATCGDSTHIEITAAPGGGRRADPRWHARCTRCGLEWDFTDVE